MVLQLREVAGGLGVWRYGKLKKVKSISEFRPILHIPKSGLHRRVHSAMPRNATHILRRVMGLVPPVNCLISVFAAGVMKQWGVWMFSIALCTTVRTMIDTVI